MEQVVVDTGVLGASLKPQSNLWVTYAPKVLGRLVVVSAQTIAELRFGALDAGWGKRRLDELDRLTSTVVVAPVDDDLVWAQAQLRVACRKAGHPLANPAHTGDLWVAATAIHFAIPLIAHDGIFKNVPDLELITEL